MNYYEDSKCNYLTNNYLNCYDNDYNFNNYYSNNKYCYENDYEKRHCNKPSCCVKRVEETFYCLPSYYNEQNKDDKKINKHEKCFEGTFKICPKICDNKEETNKDCYEKDNYNHCGKSHHKCSFCGLFGRW